MMFATKLIRLSATANRVSTIENLTNNARFYSMKAWTVTSQSPELFLLDARIPTLASPNDVLVNVHSASVNPLDVRMRNGYGRRVLDLLNLITNCETRITNDRYPLTLGRDFSGVVVSTGPNVTDYKAGDSVYGSIEPQRSGSQAQFVTVPNYCLNHKPNNISHNDASAVPFVALTAWSALCTFGGLSEHNCNGKSVLVVGGSGGVGSFAIQLLKLWGANVTATCSSKKMDWLVNTLLVDEAVSYEDTNQLELLKGRFDFVLDCGAYDKLSQTHQQSVENSIKYLRPYKSSMYVTLSPPFLKNTDEQGLILGATKSIVDAAVDTIKGLTNLNSVRWAFYLPNKSALNYVTRLLEQDIIRPLVWKEFSFNQMPDAYEELLSGNVKGKVIVDVTKVSSNKESS